MPRNDAAAPGHVCPGIRIHAIDIVQPPGIGISPIADMDAHQAIVNAALAAKSSAETPKKTCCEGRSETMRRGLPFHRSALVILVVAAPPDARLVTSLGGAVEPLVHAPEAVHSARIGGIRVVDDTVLEDERAHARPLACVSGHVGYGHRRHLGARPLVAAPLQRRLALVVVLDASLALLLLGEPDAEVEVEVAAERGRPRKRPPHSPLVRLQLLERCARHCPEHHVMIGQVHYGAVETVRDRRARGAPCRVVWAEHEVVDENLRAPSEEVRQRCAPLIGLESILLIDPNPRQFLPPPHQFVAVPREFLLRLEQFEPRCQPLFTCPGLVCRHRVCFLSCVDRSFNSRYTWWLVVMRYY